MFKFSRKYAKFIVSITLLAFINLLCINSVYANKIMAIKKGDVAQYDGFLLDTEGLLRVRNGKKNAEESCKLQIDYELKKSANKNEYNIKICEIKYKNERERNKKIEEIQAKENERLRNIIINSTNRVNLLPLWISLSFIAGAGIAIGIAFAIKPTVEQK